MRAIKIKTINSLPEFPTDNELHLISEPESVVSIEGSVLGDTQVVLKLKNGEYAAFYFVLEYDRVVKASTEVLQYWEIKNNSSAVWTEMDLLNYALDMTNASNPTRQNPYDLARKDIKKSLESWIDSTDSTFDVSIIQALNDKHLANLLTATFVNDDAPSASLSYNKKCNLFTTQALDIKELIDDAIGEPRGGSAPITGMGSSVFGCAGLFTASTESAVINLVLSAKSECNLAICENFINKFYQEAIHTKYVEGLNSELQGVDADIKSVEDDLTTAEKQLTEEETSLDQAEAELGEEEDNLKSTQATLTTTEAALANCIANCAGDQPCIDACNNNEEFGEAVIAKITDEIASIENNITGLQESIAKLKANIITVGDEINGLQNQLKFLNTEKNQLEIDIAKSTEAADVLENICNQS